MYHDVMQALSILQRGGTILYPTDTIWGVGCDATDEKAVEKVYEIKRRNETKSMLVLVNDVNMLSLYLHEIPDVALQLLCIDDDKPLSIIYPEAKNLAKNLIAPDGSIGIRVVKKDVFCQTLIQKLGRPLVSTSANISGANTPVNFSEISEEIKTAVDYVAQWRRFETTPASASSIVKIETDGRLRIIRM